MGSFVVTMMKHYYTDNQDLISNPEEFAFYYRGYHLRFLSDNGVFSKKMVDYGSRVLLEAIDIDASKQSLLDVGCGYGPLGICLKTVYPFLKVDMVDINSRAVFLTQQNIDLNQIDANAFISDAYEKVEDKYDIIVTNPPIRAGKKVVTNIIVKAKEYLNDNGELWVVIQKKQGAPSAKKNIELAFGNVEIVKRDKGYYILKAINK